MNKLERIVTIVGMSAHLLSYPVAAIAAVNVIECDSTRDELEELDPNYSARCEKVAKDYREKRNQEDFSIVNWGRNYAIDEYLNECIAINNGGVI